MLRRDGFTVAVAGTGREALEIATSDAVSVAIVDLALPDTSGIALIPRLVDARSDVECIVLTGMHGDEFAESARLAGASDYFEKGSMDTARFLQVVRRAAEVHHLRHTIGLLEPRSTQGRLLGDSPAMERVRALVDRMAGASAPVLLTGESGVGKEVVAEALHEQSRRRGEFVRINCAALPEALVEAELFGAEEGTFTGQKGRREGLFALADRGTLFLDEIGEMPIDLQPKLLRVLQSQRYRPLGSATEREVTARVVAATNVDLKAAVRGGTFREDLYYRLAVLEIDVPPLRERRADIPLLAVHFARKFGASEGRPGVRLSDEALAALASRRWPGNVRELANAVLRAVVLSTSAVIGADEVGAPAEAADPHAADFLTGFMDRPLTEAKAAIADALAREYVRAKLRQTGGNVTRAATLAGMQRPNFRREMSRLGIEPDADGA
jgi:DNA-binding NtrC family response regulator